MVSTFLQQVIDLPFYKGQMVHVEPLPAQEAEYGILEKPLNPTLQDHLRSSGISQLYSHQAAAVNLVRRGHYTAVGVANPAFGDSHILGIR